MTAFLMTFHLFGSAQDFFSLLVARFTMHPPPGLTADDFALWTEKKLFPIQGKVASAIKVWMESNWIEQYDDVCLDDIHQFATTVMIGPQPYISGKIIDLVSKKVFLIAKQTFYGYR